MMKLKEMLWDCLMSFIEAMMMSTLILSQHGCSSLVMVHARPLMNIPASVYLTIIFVLVDDQTQGKKSCHWWDAKVVALDL